MCLRNREKLTLRRVMAVLLGNLRMTINDAIETWESIWQPATSNVEVHERRHHVLRRVLDGGDTTSDTQNENHPPIMRAHSGQCQT